MIALSCNCWGLLLRVWRVGALWLLLLAWAAAGAQSPLAILKRADKPVIQPGESVTYTYIVTNSGPAALTNVVVTDDNGTPTLPSDDFVVGTLASLAPGAAHTFTQTLIPPVTVCLSNTSGTNAKSGTLIAQILTNGNVRVTFIQDTNVNDNTYGTNAIGWGSKGHTFGNLTGSDRARFGIKDKSGKTVMTFDIDYISASSKFPSGYGTLGVLGGDGGMILGAASNILEVTTSLTENLNKQPFLSNLSRYTVHSPGTNDPNRAAWEYRMIYSAVIHKRAFGTNGFGTVAIVDQHNSPAKPGFTGLPSPCNDCVTNLAVATARLGAATVSNSATAVVCVGTNFPNRAPVAYGQSLTTPEDTPLPITLIGTDVDNDPLTFIIVSGPAHGTLSGTGANRIYTPAPNYHGPDSFTYKVNDGRLDSGVATVSITVTPVNDAPVANGQSVTTPEDTPVPVTLTGSDADGDSLTFSVISGPAHGTLSGSGANLVYTPHPNYHGPDSFNFIAHDGTTSSAPATVNITVTPVNDAPVAHNQSVTVLEDTPKPIVLTGSDADGNALTFHIVAGPSHGTLSGAAPNLTYTPAPDYFGPDSFTYRVNDGALNSSLATVSITVLPVNDPPSFTPGANQLVQQNSGAQSLPNWATNLSPGPANEAGQTLTFLVSNSNPALFSAQPAISANGTLTFTPALGAFGTATVTVVLRDNGGTANGGVDASAPQTFTIVVNAPPVVSLVTPTNGAVFIVGQIIPIIANATDPDGVVTQVVFLAGTNTVGATTNPPFAVNWTNAPAGTHTFTAVATDNHGATGTSAPVTVTVLESLPLTVVSAMQFNPQTTLFEETIRVTNPTPYPITAVRVLARNLQPSGAVLFNASGTNTHGVPFAQYNLAVAPGGTAELVVKYFVPNRQTPTRTLAVEVAPLLPGIPVPFAVTPIPIERLAALPNGSILVEWSSLSNRMYYVQYSTDMKNWKTAMQPVMGSGQRRQWIDYGQPVTDSLPTSETCRFYRLIMLP
jgi:uncharacterized repeat protein (TIGR01451 family)